MQVLLETASGLERRLTITVPAKTVDEQVDERLRNMSKRVKLDGFRPGKVPFKIVKKRYGPGARQDVLGEVIESSYREAIAQEELQPAGFPKVEPRSVEEGRDLEFVITVEVYPEIKVAEFAQISIEKPVAKVTEEDIDKVLETLREQNKDFVASKEGASAEQGDQVTIDYKGTVDGEAFAGGAAEDHDLVLGSGSMISGFEDGVVGMKAGEHKDIDVTFPEDYRSEELRGKNAVFTVTVKNLQKPVLPELNDEFFLGYGMIEGGLEAFRAEIKKNMERELTQAIKTKVKNQVMDALLAIHEVQLPTALVAKEIVHLKQQAAEGFIRHGGKGVDPEKFPDQPFQKEAEKRVGLGLIIGEIIKTCDMKPEEERVHAMVEGIASAYQEPEQVVDWYHSSEEELSKIRYVVLEDQVVDTVLDAAQVSEKSCSYEEAIKPIPTKTEEDSEEKSEEA